MSASSKKKLRKEQNAAALTEKQRAEQKEAKKLKAYSISFIAIMLVVVITAVSVMTVTGINRSGIFQKNTIAAVVNGHELNTVEMTYFFKDAISSTYNEWYSNYGDSTSTIVSWLLNLDLTKPLDEQEHTDGCTWADRFMETALENAKSTYTLAALAEEQGHKLTEDEQKELDNNLYYTSLYASLYSYDSVDSYLQALYGFGADEESYTEYLTRQTLATSYYNYIYDSFSYEDPAIREYEEGKYDNYSSFTYSWYYVDYNDYLTGGTKGEDGKTTYSDDEIAAAKALAKADAEKLAKVLDLEEFKTAVADLEVNAEDATASVTTSTSVLYTSIPEIYAKWLAEEGRQENNITFIEDETTSTDDDGKETSTPNGSYYVVQFQSRNDNTRYLANVRHLLVAFEGGTKDEDGNTTYSDAEKAAAKAKAEGFLKTWKEGEATVETFIELVKKNSDDSGSKAEGGLIEDITPASNYVENFLNWSIDDTRKAGDTDVIETEYGYHVMYYVGDGELTYRDYLITNDMLTEDMEEWYNDVMEDSTSSFKDLSRMDTSIAISG